MFDVKNLGVGLIIGVFIGGVACWQIAYDRGNSHGAKIERENAKQVVADLIVENNNAKGQIDKVNSAKDEQIAILVDNFARETDNRIAAQKSMETAVRVSATNANKAFDTITGMRAQLTLISDSCAAAGVDPSLIQLFNNAIATSFEPGASKMSSANRESGSLISKPSP